jgi:anti-sigma-K factor RskA
MTEPIFRYIVVLLAVVVVLRILLNIPVGKKQEEYDQAVVIVIEGDATVDEIIQQEIQQEVNDNSQLPDLQDQESHHD